MIEDSRVFKWLLEGDPAIRWQVYRDLIVVDQKTIQKEQALIAREGWGAKLLSQQESDGRFGGGLYNPKWISTTYTLLLLCWLGLDPDYPDIQKSCRLLLEKGLYRDGGINYFRSMKCSETCVTGMILRLLSYFRYSDDRIQLLVEYLLREQMPDGGWNCQRYNGAGHSSFHTTINVLEGLSDFSKFSHYQSIEIQERINQAVEFLLQHNLYKSHRSGWVFDSRMTRFSFPPYWRYDILRVLDFFQTTHIPYDHRMADALTLVKKRQQPDGRWLLQNRQPGRTYFEMEKTGEPSRWNTLRAIRVLKFYQPDAISFY